MLSVASGGIADIATNPNTAVSALALNETRDSLLPELLEVYADYSNGFIALKWSEIMDFTPVVDRIHLDKIALVNATTAMATVGIAASPDVDFDGTQNPGGGTDGAAGIRTSSDGYWLNLTLTESQRVRAISYSGTVGGDGAGARLRCFGPGDGGSTAGDTLYGCVQDIGTNFNFDQTVTVSETADTEKPRITGASIDFNDGTLVFTTSETVNILHEKSGRLVAPPIVEQAQLSLGDTAGAPIFNLASADLLSTVDALSVTLQLPELHRIAAILKSDVPGGDPRGSALVFDALDNAFFDVAHNGNAETLGTLVTETADNTRPSLIKAELFLSDGVLQIYADETLRAVLESEVNGAEIYLRNAPSPSSDRFNLPLSKYVASAPTAFYPHSKSINITLTEEQRATAIARSEDVTKGGDGVSLTLDVTVGAVVDVAGNSNNELTGLVISETPDTVSPLVESARINYSTGFIEFFTSETIDVTPVNSGDPQLSIIFLDRLRLHTSNMSMYLLSLNRSGVIETQHYSTSRDGDTLAVGVRVNEDDRIALLKASSQPGGVNFQKSLAYFGDHDGGWR